MSQIYYFSFMIVSTGYLAFEGFCQDQLPIALLLVVWLWGCFACGRASAYAEAIKQLVDLEASMPTVEKP